METIVIVIASFFTAVLTFFSGFGLGTILTPVFAIFFPIDLAIALTGVVHFFNNVFKLFLVGKKADKPVLIKFGIPAVIAAVAGAWLLLNISAFNPLFSYSMGPNEFVVTPLRLIIAMLLIAFAIIDLVPFFDRLQFGREKLPLGGVLSGFFGGLSGHQGALRTAFLIKAGLSKEAFVASSVVIASFVDFTRLSIYATRFLDAGLAENITLVILATLSAMAGAFFGNRLLKKVTFHFLQRLVAVMLILISLALGAGWI